MGTTYAPGHTRAQAIRSATSPWKQGGEVVSLSKKTKPVPGGVWDLRAEKDAAGSPRFRIYFHKIVRCRLTGDPKAGWGWDTISEASGPAWVDCPVEWLDEAPEPTTPWASEWREKVREHARAAQFVKGLKVGDAVSLLTYGDGTVFETGRAVKARLEAGRWAGHWVKVTPSTVVVKGL